MFGTGILRRATKVVAYGATGGLGAGAKTLAVGTRGSRIKGKNLKEMQAQTRIMEQQTALLAAMAAGATTTTTNVDIPRLPATPERHVRTIFNLYRRAPKTLPDGRATTPGYNGRLTISFVTTERGKRRASYFSTATMRPIRLRLLDAEAWVAQDLADVAPDPSAALAQPTAVEVPPVAQSVTRGTGG